MPEGKDLINPETERAISLLDPARNYGPRTFTDVVEGIYAGEILINLIEGARNPMLRDATTGRTIKGSGASPPPVTVTQHQWAAKKFMERALEDFDSAYDALMAEIEKGNVLAIKVFMEKFVPRAPDIVGQARNDILSALMEKLSTSGSGSTLEVVEIDEYGRPYRDGDDDGE